ncbi:hypothetical protein [Flavobacterium sp.]|uniref:hypothetical protein n=1 Tax=Flavobacterium sp. TaxID=239 RepID=UPI00374D8029
MKTKLAPIFILLFTTFTSFFQEINGTLVNLYNSSKNSNGIAKLLQKIAKLTFTASIKIKKKQLAFESL